MIKNPLWFEGVITYTSLINKSITLPPRYGDFRKTIYSILELKRRKLTQYSVEETNLVKAKVLS